MKANVSTLPINGRDNEWEIRFSQNDSGGSEETYFRLGSIAQVTDRNGGVRNIPIRATEVGEDRIEASGRDDEFDVRVRWTRDRGTEHAVWDAEISVRFIGSEVKEYGIRFAGQLMGPGRPTWMIPGGFLQAKPLCRKFSEVSALRL